MGSCSATAAFYGPGTGVGAILDDVRRRFPIVGEAGVSLMTRIRGASNAKA
jgi:hypothetical protein